MRNQNARSQTQWYSAQSRDLGQAVSFRFNAFAVRTVPNNRRELEGCGVRFSHPLEIGTRVHLEGLPEKRSITARVVNCISLGDYEKFWFLGLALDEPGNVWGIKTPPEDWHTYPPLARR
jgi:hypothetical protein